MKHSVLISDRDTYIAVAGASKKEFKNKSIGELVEKAMDERQSKMETATGSYHLVGTHPDELKGYVIAPIIASGDPIGAVVIFSKEQALSGSVEQKLAETAASFLARQMEQ